MTNIEKVNRRGFILIGVLVLVVVVAPVLLVIKSKSKLSSAERSNPVRQTIINRPIRDIK